MSPDLQPRAVATPREWESGSRRAAAPMRLAATLPRQECGRAGSAIGAPPAPGLRSSVAGRGRLTEATSLRFAVLSLVGARRFAGTFAEFGVLTRVGVIWLSFGLCIKYPVSTH